MKKLFVAFLVLAVCFLFCGFAPKETKYFTIHYENQRIVVSDKTLRPAWYNLESHIDFTKGKTIYQRASSITLQYGFEKEQLASLFPEIYHIIKKVERDVERSAFNGNIQFDPNGKEKFWVTGAQHGVEMDVAVVAREVLAALKSQKHADILVKTKQIPHKSAKEVLSKIGLRAQYSTRFDAGNVKRSENIERSAMCFNGFILGVGEDLSFNRVVGPRTAVRGYEEAKIIIDGEFVPGIGGGVCQTSTTLFNAALLSGLSVVESHNHSLPISYVPLGRDAMVSSAVDLVLQNSTGAPIYIEAGIEKTNQIFVNIYGNKLGNIKYKPTTEVTSKPQEVEVIGAMPDEISAYNKVIIERGEPARSVRTHLEIYNGNRLVNKKLVRKSNYKGKPEKIKYELISLTSETQLDIIE